MPRLPLAAIRATVHVAILAVALMAARPAGADIVVIPASRDNTLYEDPTGSLSNGAGQLFFAGRTSVFTNAVRRAVIAFDIAGSVPAGSTIGTVTLTLHVTRVPVLVTDTSAALHRVLADWGEGASAPAFGEGGGALAEPGDATWVHRFFDTTFWTTQGGDFSATASATATVSGVGFYSWGPTAALLADVQGWLDDPAGNHGWLLKGVETTLESARGYDTRDAITVPNRPVLTISYTAPVATAGRVPDGGPVPGLPVTVDHAAGGQITLAWGASCRPGDTDYAIYEGTLGAFYSHTMTLCTTGGALTATFLPAPGDSYYLIVPRNAGREGSYGVSSAGLERPPGVPACLPQNIAACP
jgi:hypothetical protein